MAALAFISVRAPELVGTPGIDNLIAMSDDQTGAFENSVMIGTMGTKRDLAVALRTLHIITRDKLRAEGSAGLQGGAISSESEGSLSRSYTISETDRRQYPDLVTTSWGVELIALIRANFFLPVNRMML